MNNQKGNTFTSDQTLARSLNPIFIDVGHGFVELVRNTEVHKYLGNSFPGDLASRGKELLRNRLKCAWSKFHLFRHALTDKHVDLRLRLRLFDSVVAPSAFYGLSTAPLTSHDFEKLAATQRRMLRLIIGYSKQSDDTWEDMYRRIKHKMTKAMGKSPTRDWAKEVKRRKAKLQEDLMQNLRNRLVCEVSRWDPRQIHDPKLPTPPRKGPGRPRTPWHVFP